MKSKGVVFARFKKASLVVNRSSEAETERPLHPQLGSDLLRFSHLTNN